MKLITKLLLLFLVSTLFLTSLEAQEYDENGYPIVKGLSEEDMVRIFGDMFSIRSFKVNGKTRHLKESLINGNKITTILYNYGSICKPNTLGNVGDLVWQGLGYGFEFGPLAAADVTGNDGNQVQIVSDSFVLTGQGDYNPDGTIKWGWLPKNGYVDTTEGQTEIARLGIGDEDPRDGKPDSWPESWYNPSVGKYLWPAFLGDQASAPDEEVYYVVDDYSNEEFPSYTPSNSDPNMHGLGLDMEVRILQFNNSLAEDIMFLVYQISNASDKKIEEAYFGMHGDPHVGGPADYADDKADFIDPFGNSIHLNGVNQRARSMVYAWDGDGVGDAGRSPGYFGWKFLESPSNAVDLIDNDDDGITDESPDNSSGEFIDGESIPLNTGISDVAKYTAIYGKPRPRWSGDEDGDWDLEKDDIGIDGIGPESENYPGPDYGEGDGVPSQGWELNGTIGDERTPGSKWAGSELNYGLRDISESDQIGLSSFHAATYTNSDPNVPRNDPLMWEWLSSDTISTDQELLNNPGDNIFNFGTGPLSLEQGESQRFSMTILFGNNVDHLLLNAETSTRILESDYRFAKPPTKPNLSVVPGDGRVTLYWDDASEKSFDPFIRTFDFQGYKIYRSQDPTFSDVKTITDGLGNPFIGKGIAQFDVVDSLEGFHPIEYVGRGVKYYIGSNSGLVHEYVDSNVTNGVTYYYALAAYDGGSEKFSIPPTETQTIIDVDPVTSELTFDVNTGIATPMKSTSGYSDAEAGTGGIPDQITGDATGSLVVKIVEPTKVQDRIFTIEFEEVDIYNVYDSTGVEESFVSKDTVFVNLSKENIKTSSVEVTDESGNVIDQSQYIIKEDQGKIRGNNSGDLTSNQKFNIKYNYYPVFNSTLIDSSDANPAFDGQRIFVQNHPLDLDESRCEWDEESETNVRDSVLWSKSNANYPGTPHVQYRADWEVRWLDYTDTLEDGSWANGDSAFIIPSNSLTSVPFNIVNISEVDDQGNYVKGNFLINEIGYPNENGKWDWGEPLLLRPTDAPGATVSYFLQFDLRPDTLASIDTTWIDDSTFVADTTINKYEPVYPKEGDIYHVRTSKPFEVGDLYRYEAKAAEYKPKLAEETLDEIFVVPNPYVVYSDFETPGRLPGQRGDKKLKFKNLPPECTIRIYTIIGELVSVIEKNDNTSTAAWDLLSDEGHRVAYGVYIYHVEVPDVGDKIGRFGVIK
ncbi:MAG: hypothetical protein ABFS12_00210 [Bacteroidota bacterium]